MIKATGIPSDERVSKLADAAVRTAVPDRHGLRLVPHRLRSRSIRPRIPRIRSGRTSRAWSGTSTRACRSSWAPGMPKTSIEWQMFTHARPGVTDTSAISHDQVNNPGTMNSIINLAQRPLFTGEVVTKWRKADTCGGEKDEDKCWCEPGRDNKCWARSTQQRRQDAGPRRRPSHPERRRGFDRRPRSDPAGLFQHRLLRRGVLGQSPDRLSPGRSRAARLRPDVVSHRPVPARLPALPRDRGSARRTCSISSFPPRATRRICTSPAIASARPRTAGPATTRART